MTKRDTRDSALRSFGRWITSFSWDEVLSIEDCKEKFDLLSCILMKAVNRLLPLKSFWVHATDKPWITQKIKSLVAHRQRALAKYGKDSPSFKLLRNKLQRAIATAKNLFYENNVKALKDSSVSKWWKEVKCISVVSDDPGQWFLQLVDGNSIDSVTSLCERINDFFVNLTSDFVPLSPSDVSSIEVCDVPLELLATPYETEKGPTFDKGQEGSWA